MKKPRLHRPPKSDTDTAIRTKNRYDALEMESDYPSSDSESQNHFNLFTMSSTIQWNIRGLQANLEELSMLPSDFDPTLVCRQETYHRSDKPANFSNYCKKLTV